MNEQMEQPDESVAWEIVDSVINGISSRTDWRVRAQRLQEQMQLMSSIRRHLRQFSTTSFAENNSHASGTLPVTVLESEESSLDLNGPITRNASIRRSRSMTSSNRTTAFHMPTANSSSRLEDLIVFCDFRNRIYFANRDGQVFYLGESDNIIRSNRDGTRSYPPSPDPRQTNYYRIMDRADQRRRYHYRSPTSLSNFLPSSQSTWDLNGAEVPMREIRCSMAGIDPSDEYLDSDGQVQNVSNPEIMRWLLESSDSEQDTFTSDPFESDPEDSPLR